MPTPASQTMISTSADDVFEPSAELMARIAAQLRPTQPRAPATLPTRLRDRVGASVAAHRNFYTVRHEQRVSQPESPGLAWQPLRNNGVVRVDIGCLAPNAELPRPSQPQELLVLQGSLLDPQSQASWQRHEHLLQIRGATPLRAGNDGARVYRRSLLDPSSLGAAELAWWAGEDDLYAKDWWELGPGVELKNLRGRNNILSMLIRVQPGTVLGDHGHPQEEDCLVLDGELFLGDILLRPDDYHVAPPGTQHVNGLSEPGTLLFVHGAVPA